MTNYARRRDKRQDNRRQIAHRLCYLLDKLIDMRGVKSATRKGIVGSKINRTLKIFFLKIDQPAFANQIIYP